MQLINDRSMNFKGISFLLDKYRDRCTPASRGGEGYSTQIAPITIPSPHSSSKEQTNREPISTNVTMLSNQPNNKSATTTMLAQNATSKVTVTKSATQTRDKRQPQPIVREQLEVTQEDFLPTGMTLEDPTIKAKEAATNTEIAKLKREVLGVTKLHD